MVNPAINSYILGGFENRAPGLNLFALEAIITIRIRKQGGRGLSVE